ncbi:MAG: protoheme IX farnesyltransferase [Flammeovirgaceae bacterium]|jgi:protoheme IX farnesyltransferase
MYQATILQQQTMADKAKQFWILTKFRLSALVVFSGAFGFVMGNEGAMDWVKFSVLLFGSFIITASANTINQVIEKDLDKLMNRTANRPLPTGLITPKEGILFATLLAIIGTVLLVVFVNVFTAGLALLSLILYGFVYTPLKQKTPISVLVGAFPGAFPPLIGWVAATNEITMGAIIIYGIQFFWQFPHFWAIAWVGAKDYANAGFKMLPYGKTLQTATQIMIYTLFLIPLTLLPFQTGMTSATSAVVAGIATLVFLGQSFWLIKKQTDKAALQIMFGSFFYLPILQITYMLTKI